MAARRRWVTRHRFLRGAFARHGGVEVDDQGEALFYTFSRAGTEFALSDETDGRAAEGQAPTV